MYSKIKANITKCVLAAEHKFSKIYVSKTETTHVGKKS